MASGQVRHVLLRIIAHARRLFSSFFMAGGSLMQEGALTKQILFYGGAPQGHLSTKAYVKIRQSRAECFFEEYDL